MSLSALFFPTTSVPILEMMSAGCSAAIEENHVLSVGRRWKRWSEQVVVQLWSKITYSLWAGDGRDEVSGLFCSYQARSRTSCGRAMREMQLVGCCVAMEQDHILSVGGETESAGCCAAIVRLLSKIGTYRLCGWAMGDLHS
jgi:hypothetical protein